MSVSLSLSRFIPVSISSAPLSATQQLCHYVEEVSNSCGSFPDFFTLIGHAGREAACFFRVRKTT